MRWVLIACLAGLAIVNSVLAAEDRKYAISGAIFYENAERTHLTRFDSEGMARGPNTPKRPIGPQKEEFIEYLGTKISDCSDNSYRCVASGWQVVWAVPRGKLSLKMSYTVRGTIFTVKECLRGVGDVCQVALVEGDCQYVKSTGLRECAPYPDGRSASPDQGAVSYFIYNEDYGITSYGILSDYAEDESRSYLARENVLQGTVGLLKP